MPTLRSYWEGRDIELRRGLNLYPTADIEAEVVREREGDREALLAALREQGLNPASPATPHEPFTRATRERAACVPRPVAPRCWWRCRSKICWA